MVTRLPPEPPRTIQLLQRHTHTVQPFMIICYRTQWTKFGPGRRKGDFPEDNGVSPCFIVPGYDEPQSQYTKSIRIYYLLIGFLRSSVSSEARYFSGCFISMSLSVSS